MITNLTKINQFLSTALSGGNFLPRVYEDAKKLHKGKIKVYKTTRNGQLIRVKADRIKKLLKSKRDEFGLRLCLLPNCSAFHIKLQSYNPLLLAFGIISRYGSQRKIVTYKNRSANRYLLYQYYRLYKSYTNKQGELYFKITTQLQILSKSYMVAVLHYKDKNLYRKYRQDKLQRLIKEITTIRGMLMPPHVLRAYRSGRLTGDNLMRHYINYKRVYLSKGTTWRPLGVPNISWRIFNSMLLIPLTGYIPVSNNQQGFVPYRGTLTAWHEVVTKVLPSRNILEIDFEGYFPSITSDYVSESLEKLELPVPPYIIKYLENMNYSRPHLTFNEKKDHTGILLPDFLHGYDFAYSLKEDYVKR